LAAWAVLATGGPAGAQQSASFVLEGSTLNEGGRPIGGVVAQSASFQLTLDAVGDAAPGLAASSASFGLSGGIVGAYAPPSEVQTMAFGPGAGSATAVLWTPIPTAVRYDVYRGPTGQLPGTFGSCLASNLVGTAYNDPAAPGSRTGFFYLVTGENRLGEEGTKGAQSNGTVRTAAPACP
jgi:hypothetical protein